MHPPAASASWTASATALFAIVMSSPVTSLNSAVNTSSLVEKLE